MRGEPAAVAPLAAALALLLFAGRAEAHAVGVSRGEYSVEGATVRAELAFARGELAASIPALDANGDGTLDRAEIAGGRAGEVLRSAVVGGIDVREGGASCAPLLDGARLTEGDGLVIDARWTCAPRALPDASIEVKLLAALSQGHRHIARARSAAGAVDDVLYAAHDRLDVIVPSASSSPAAGPGAGGFRSFVGMGISHILAGYDHLLFLFGLVLVGGRARSLALVVSAFTVAHSITLALATLGVWAPSPRMIEPAIALSIAYVGVENFFLRDASKRWRVTFPFGLVHGFGFAGALREIALPRAQIPAALVGFNVGVEVGQLAVMAMVLPAILVARRSGWFEGRAVRVLNASIVVAGVCWFVQRLALA